MTSTYTFLKHTNNGCRNWISGPKKGIFQASECLEYLCHFGEILQFFYILKKDIFCLIQNSILCNNMLMMCYLYNYQIDFSFATPQIWQIEQLVFMLNPLFVFWTLDKIRKQYEWMNEYEQQVAHIINFWCCCWLHCPKTQ